MLFNSLSYFVFLPIVVLVYFLLPHKFRWGFLLLASCYFYMAFIPKYILILLVLIIIDFLAALGIEAQQGKKRKALLIASIMANVGILVVYKYYGFFSENLTALATMLHWNLPLPILKFALPLGLSFHTFQSMSYTIEVYKGKWKAERHLGIYALYVLFFPQLVAGPIERPAELLPQFRHNHIPEPQNFSSGLKRILWGLFKKTVLADHLAVVVTGIFSGIGNFSGVPIIISAIFFSYQIYCDFSGYSDIAIGSAQILGFRLRENFNNPYWAHSTRDFWKRWHMSLTSWFRDYVYIPLGGNRVSRGRWAANILATFLLSGLWHGANWNFIAWGALHGSYQILSVATLKFRESFKRFLHLLNYPGALRAIGTAWTFFLVSLAWIFFRSPNMADALNSFTNIVRHPSCSLTGGSWHVSSCLTQLNLSVLSFGFLIFGIFFLEFINYLNRGLNPSDFLGRQPAWVRWSVYYFLIICILFLGFKQRYAFIYFQF